VKHPTNAAAQTLRSIGFLSRFCAWVSCTKAKKQVTDINSKMRPKISKDLRGVFLGVLRLSIDPYDSLEVIDGEGFVESESEIMARQIIAKGI
jgi:hypothetical protein